MIESQRMASRRPRPRPSASFLAIAVTAAFAAGPARADEVRMKLGPSAIPDGVVVGAGARTDSLGAFSIAIQAGSALASNPAAMAAFERAARQWTDRISDPISILIDADLASLGAGILGQAETTLVAGNYTTIRNAMAADALAGGAPEDAIVAALPAASQLGVFMPVGFGLAGDVVLASANAKALGFAVPVGSDARITFNSDFEFDFDNRDGVDAGKTDFETVAAHEIGHALGFLSAVDEVDFLLANGLSGVVALNPLDLFRFDKGLDDPATEAEFTLAARSLVPGGEAVLDTIDVEYRMSTGAFLGDGRQAGHWKDDSLTSLRLGVMDPTLATAIISPVDEADFRAISLIGYDVRFGPAPIPEPSACLMLSMGAAGVLGLARRRRAA